MKKYKRFEYCRVMKTDLELPEYQHILEYTKNTTVFGYADIKGYPIDEDKTNNLICRVWLTSGEESITSWYDNDYLRDESVEVLINKVQNDLINWFNEKNMMVKNIFKKAYERYKLDWMIDHGFTIGDLLAALHKQLENDAKDVKDAFEKFQSDAGFRGEIWMCEDEFRNREWDDKDHMRKFLTDDEYEIYSTRWD